MRRCLAPLNGCSGEELVVVVTAGGSLGFAINIVCSPRNQRKNSERILSKSKCSTGEGYSDCFELHGLVRLGY